jgi:hypothetical protein
VNDLEDAKTQMAVTAESIDRSGASDERSRRIEIVLEDYFTRAQQAATTTINNPLYQAEGRAQENPLYQGA